MATLTITDKQAREIYPSASTELQAILEASFGKEFFTQKITDRVKTFEDACAVLDLDPKDVLDINDTPDEEAYKKLKVIVKALNEDWAPNWDDEDEYKWYPWFYLNSARGFSLNCVFYHYSFSVVSSRLCFRSEELAQYAAKQFLDTYKAFFTL